MRTLTKERVNTSGLANDSSVLSMDLIGDGPNEVIYKKLINFSEVNDKVKRKADKEALIRSDQKNQENIVRAEQSIRKEYAKMVISKYTKMFGIDREQMKDIVKELKDEDFRLLENTVFRRLKKRAIFQVVGSFGSLVTFVGSSLGYLLFGNLVAGCLAATIFITTGAGCMLPCIFLHQFFWGNDVVRDCHWNDFRGSDCGWFGSRRTLKNKYGSNYFPYQELREELGLVEKINE